ncbi:MAG: VTT domain-containing protein [Thermoanaerobaculia bacterium]
MHELFLHVARYGLLLVFANVFLEQIGLPIPAIPTLIAAGALAAEGRLSGPLLIALAITASVIADTAWFLLGRKHGYRILKTVCGISLSPDSCVRQTESLFERHGLRSLLFAKFVPGFSTVAPPLAGAVGAALGSFLLYDGGGSLLWAGSGILAGHVFHRQIDRVAEVLEGMGFWALVAAASALALFVAWKWWQRRRFYKFLRMARISVHEVRRLIDEGRNPVIVDARSKASFLRDPRHVPGALRIVLEDLDRQVSDLPMNREIVLYCT